VGGAGDPLYITPKAGKMNPQDKIDEAVKMGMALDKSMAAIRFLAGHYEVCPVCFVKTLAGILTDLAEGGNLKHGEPVEKITTEEAAEMFARKDPFYVFVEEEDEIGEPQGNA
jgi:hypothetical protein